MSPVLWGGADRKRGRQTFLLPRLKGDPPCLVQTTRGAHSDCDLSKRWIYFTTADYRFAPMSRLLEGPGRVSC